MLSYQGAVCPNINQDGDHHRLIGFGSVVRKVENRRRGWGNFPPCQDCCDSELGESSMDKIRRDLSPTGCGWDVLFSMVLSIMVLAASHAGTEGSDGVSPTMTRLRKQHRHHPCGHLPWPLSVFNVC